MPLFLHNRAWNWFQFGLVVIRVHYSSIFQGLLIPRVLLNARVIIHHIQNQQINGGDSVVAAVVLRSPRRAVCLEPWWSKYWFVKSGPRRVEEAAICQWISEKYWIRSVYPITKSMSMALREYPHPAIRHQASEACPWYTVTLYIYSAFYHEYPRNIGKAE